MPAHFIRGKGFYERGIIKLRNPGAGLGVGIFFYPENSQTRVIEKERIRTIEKGVRLYAENEPENKLDEDGILQAGMGRGGKAWLRIWRS